MPHFDREDFWWEADEDDLHQKVYDHVAGLEEENKETFHQHLRYAKVYGNDNLLAFDWGHRAGERKSRVGTHENVIKSACDTAAAMIAKNRPAITFLTEGGNFSQKRRAKMLEKFVMGIFQTGKVYKEAVRVFRDATIFGTGFMKVFVDDGDFCCERVMVDEIVVDELACRSAPPRDLYQRKFVDREALIADYPEHEDAIRESNHKSSQWTSYRKMSDDEVVVIEAWYLPPNKSTPGRHVQCVEGGTLLDEEWTWPVFPFATFHWCDPVIGFWGSGIVENNYGTQLRINKLNKFIDRCQDLVAVPRIWLNTASKILTPQITTEIGALYRYRGDRPPVFQVAQAVGAEVYQYKEQLKESIFQQEGISRMSAHAQKPVGLEAAVALREYNDIESDRFAIQAQDYEEFFLEIAKLLIRWARQENKNQKFTSIFRARSYIKKINWKDVDLDEDKYVMHVTASSILSRTPAGRKQSVKEMLQAGWIDEAEGRRLLNLPDIESSDSMATAAERDIEAVIEMLLDGEFLAPDPAQHLTRGVVLVQQAMVQARRDMGPPEKRTEEEEQILAGMRNWIEMAKHELEKASRPPDPTAAMAAGNSMPGQAPMDPMAASVAAGGPPAPSPGPAPGGGPPPIM